MKTAGILLLLAAMPAGSQIVNRPASVVASIDQPRFSLDIIHSLEKDFDRKLDAAGPVPLHVMGFSRGLYLPGYGLVFTAEVDLMNTPVSGGILNRKIEAPERASIHERKLAQLPLLQHLMQEMVTASAQRLDMMPENEHIVLAVRLWYQGWEDQTRLPSQIVMSADRKSAMAGLIKEESTK
jgi:hypothetical protein